MVEDRTKWKMDAMDIVRIEADSMAQGDKVIAAWVDEGAPWNISDRTPWTQSHAIHGQHCKNLINQYDYFLFRDVNSKNYHNKIDNLDK